MKILLIAAEFAQKSEYIFLIEVRFLLDSKKNKAPSYSFMHFSISVAIMPSSFWETIIELRITSLSSIISLT